MATAKHKFQKLVFNPSNQSLVEFLGEFQKRAKDAIRKHAHAIIEKINYAKKPQPLEENKKSGPFGEWRI